MMLFQRLKLITRDEDGAVSIDWVVLTAAVVAVGVAVGATMKPAASPVVATIGPTMAQVNTTTSWE